MATNKKAKTMGKSNVPALRPEGEAWPMLASKEGASFAIESVKDMGIGLFDLPRLKVPTGGETAFKVATLTGDEYEKSMDVVILASRKGQKAWYRLSIEDGQGNAPPDCTSSDGITGFGKVSLNDPAEVAAKHDCLSCPWDKFGSKRKGGKGKDCKDFAQLLVATAAGGVPTLVTVPPGSLKALTKYAIDLINVRKRPYEVITRLTLEKVAGPPDYSRIVLTYVEDVPKELAEMTRGMSDALKSCLFSVPVTIAAREVTGDDT